MPRVPPRMTGFARSLRNDATDAERRLWAMLSGQRPRFTRQLVVGPYILDFACRQAKLAVELDGGQHGDAIERDSARTAFLEGLGWKVLRYWNSDVTENADGVAEAILEEVRARIGCASPP